MTTKHTNIMSLSAAEFTTWLDGFAHGRAEGLSEGFQRGYRVANDEMATLQRTAAEVVRKLADVPERDHAEDERRAAASRAYWAQRRGEG